MDEDQEAKIGWAGREWMIHGFRRDIHARSARWRNEAASGSQAIQSSSCSSRIWSNRCWHHASMPDAVHSDGSFRSAAVEEALRNLGVPVDHSELDGMESFASGAARRMPREKIVEPKGKRRLPLKSPDGR